ncbi:YfiR family protein [Caulobacter sp.]|uniref:YfiR/HmsC family protein n=1 Tax=Caulobacter sp. TaxID=78 RepID=UPI0016085692
MVLGVPPHAPRLRSGWRHRPLSVLAAGLVLCGLGVLLPADGAHAARQVAEPERPQVPVRIPAYVLKANYLHKFTPFTQWPATAFERPGSPFRLCIGGHDPMGEVVDRLARGRRVGEHPVVVVRLATVGKDSNCHVLFLGVSRTQTPQEVLALVAGKPVLTVADETLDAPGAVIQFVTVGGRLRFEIRPEIAQAQGLGLSSKLKALSASKSGDGR